MHQTLPKCFEGVVLRLLEDLDTPRSLTATLLIRHGEWGQLLRLKCDPAQYDHDADKYFRDVTATEFLRKCADLPGTSEQERVLNSVKAFYEAEMSCKVTNDRFDVHIHNGPFEDPADVRVQDELERVKRFIADVLGDLPKEVIGRHGPGATYGDRGERTTIPDKMSSRPTATRAARYFLPFWEGTSWCRELMRDAPNRSDPEVVKGNRFTTVPKDALKVRGIAIEPSLNVFFQLGIGGVIRRRLGKVGIDLDNGQSHHRQVARDASKTGALCTIDLSSASDTVSKKLVQYLLPAHWYECLTTLRSPFTTVSGKDVYLEKFSSMGNGFTFELETLVFLGLAVIATQRSGIRPDIGRNILVYGDDIIVPSEASRGLLALLRYCGFRPNPDKTYVTGVFRESCGGDFYNGVAVRPHYVKGIPDEPTAWISLANGLRRSAAQYYGSDVCDDPFRGAWFRALDALPGNIRRLRGPVSLGDAVIHDARDRWTVRMSGGIPHVKGYVPIPRSIPLTRWGPGAQLASALYGVPSTGPVPRKGGVFGVSGYRERWLAVQMPAINSFSSQYNAQATVT